MNATAPADLIVNRQHLPHRLDGGIASRAAIGLIVLATDQTIEHEFRRLLGLPGVAFYESRILNDARVTPETLAAMEARLVEAASLILPGLPLDVVAFGCTSASMVIGEERVFERIREVRPGVACTTPITAAFAAFEALRVRRLALLTPYRDDINRFMRDYIEARGFAVPVMGSFNEEDDRKAARIDAGSIRDAAIELGARTASTRCSSPARASAWPMRSVRSKRRSASQSPRAITHGLALPAPGRHQRRPPRVRDAVRADRELRRTRGANPCLHELDQAGRTRGDDPANDWSPNQSPYVRTLFAIDRLVRAAQQLRAEGYLDAGRRVGQHVAAAGGEHEARTAADPGIPAGSGRRQGRAPARPRTRAVR